MAKEDSEIRSLGFDIFLSVVYFTALFVSFLLIVSTLQNDNIKSALVSCLLLVLPCALDSFKDFIDCVRGKTAKDIIKIIICVLLVILTIALFVVITCDFGILFTKIVIFCSVLSCGKYSADCVFSFIELIRIKTNKED